MNLQKYERVRVPFIPNIARTLVSAHMGVHTCKYYLVGDGSIEEIFGGKGILAPGKGPDMSPLDAGACPYMERAVDDAGAETVKEIDAAVRKAWKTVDRDMCVKIMKRVRANMANVIALRGGNFYRD